MDTRPPTLAQRLVAEYVGTFALVFAGCGAMMVDALSPGLLGHIGVSAVFGLVIMVMVFATGHISGAHFNPAVTIAFAAGGHFRWRDVVPYIVVQIGAALLAAWMLSLIWGDVAKIGMTVVSGTVDDGGAFLLEVVFTAFLVFVIYAVATDGRSVGKLAGVGIGGAVALGSLTIGPVTGASMNPARSLGPATVMGDFNDLWIYLLAPILGGLVGAVVFTFIGARSAEPD